MRRSSAPIDSIVRCRFVAAADLADGLRDSVAFHLLSREHAHAIRDDLVAFRGEIAMRTPALARILALAYMVSRIRLQPSD